MEVHDIGIEKNIPSSYSRSEQSVEHDVLLSISEDGELAFWIPEQEANIVKWECTSRVKTGRKDIRMAACSSAKKSVLSEHIHVDI